MNPAPKGVGWGTTNIPADQRIDVTKQYRTRSGIRVVNLEIKLTNCMDNEVTFPVKGSIQKEGQGHKPRYAIWTLDGRASLFGEHPDDLIEVE